MFVVLFALLGTTCLSAPSVAPPLHEARDDTAPQMVRLSATTDATSMVVQWTMAVPCAGSSDGVVTYGQLWISMRAVQMRHLFGMYCAIVSTVAGLVCMKTTRVACLTLPF